MPLKKPVAHLDGDILIYRCGFAVEQRPVTVQYPDGTYEDFEGISKAKKYFKDAGIDEDSVEITRHHIVEPVENALHALDTQVDSILSDLHKITGVKHTPRMYRSIGRSFRGEVAKMKPYKGNRDEKHQPVHKQAIIEHMESRYETHSSNILEADDLLAMNGLIGGVVCSIDKDLLQVPCTHYDWTRGLFLHIDEIDAHYNLWAQVLSGDSTDNILGLPGIGTAKAYKILDSSDVPSPKAWARAVHKAYKDMWPRDNEWGYSWKQALMENGKLVYLLRDSADSWENYYESVTGVTARS